MTVDELKAKKIELANRKLNTIELISLEKKGSSERKRLVYGLNQIEKEIIDINKKMFTAKDALESEKLQKLRHQCRMLLDKMALHAWPTSETAALAKKIVSMCFGEVESTYKHYMMEEIEL